MLKQKAHAIALGVLLTDLSLTAVSLVRILPEAVIARIPIPAYDFKITLAQLDVWRNMMVTQGYPLANLDIARLVVAPE